MRILNRATVFACLLALPVACGGGGGQTATPQASEAAATSSPAGQTEASGSEAAATGGGAVTDETSGVTVTGDLGSKPEIQIPEGDPPTELVITDIAVGDGAEAVESSTVEAHYVGVSWSTGEQFDASWDSGAPVPFGLNQVIAGWTEGIPGMKVGGRRLLVIPPELGYGDTPPPVIAPGETLVFVVDLTGVQ